MRLITALVIALSIAPAVEAAQLYRWVDDKGRVEWRDTPPPPTAKNVEQRSLTPSTIPTADMPYAVQQAVKTFPVTLWVTDCGDACNRARSHLARRGIPYTEKNPHVDQDAFKKASGGSMEVPLLVVGSNRTKGYLETSWDSMLDTAGYPKTAYAGYKAPARIPDPKPAAPGAQGDAPRAAGKPSQ